MPFTVFSFAAGILFNTSKLCLAGLVVELNVDKVACIPAFQKIKLTFSSFVCDVFGITPVTTASFNTARLHSHDFFNIACLDVNFKLSTVFMCFMCSSSSLGRFESISIFFLISATEGFKIFKVGKYFEVLISWECEIAKSLKRTKNLKCHCSNTVSILLYVSLLYSARSENPVILRSISWAEHSWVTWKFVLCNPARFRKHFDPRFWIEKNQSAWLETLWWLSDTHFWQH